MTLVQRNRRASTALAFALLATAPSWAMQGVKREVQKVTAGRYLLSLEAVQPATNSGNVSTFIGFSGGVASLKGGKSGFGSSGPNQGGANLLNGAGPPMAGFAFVVKATTPNTSDLEKIEGIDPVFSATDERGKAIQLSVDKTATHVTGAEFGGTQDHLTCYSFLPLPKEIKSLATLDGNLLLTKLRREAAVFQADPLKAKGTWNSPESAVILKSIESDEKGVRVNLTVTVPTRRTAFRGDPSTFMAVMNNMRPRISATLVATDQQTYDPTTFRLGKATSKVLLSDVPDGRSSLQDATVEGEKRESLNTMTTDLTYTFPPLAKGITPASVSIEFLTRFGTTRLPFRFTNVNLTSDR
jgi:hypothetical protein